METFEMVVRCFRHQHPEAFGGYPVPGGVIPIEWRYGPDDLKEYHTPKVFDEPSDQGVEGHYPLPEATPAANQVRA